MKRCTRREFLGIVGKGVALSMAGPVVAWSVGAPRAPPGLGAGGGWAPGAGWGGRGGWGGGGAARRAPDGGE